MYFDEWFYYSPDVGQQVQRNVVIILLFLPHSHCLRILVAVSFSCYVFFQYITFQITSFGYGGEPGGGARGRLGRGGF